ncbi:MAG: adenine phosphoribosyltransferase [Verrucomicrobia bacterium]|nr:adenine phosphoribosyltransferase [Verrucomicrobiota bacterium]
MVELRDELLATIRDVRDFPKPGIVFKDITPVLSDAELFSRVIEHFADRYEGEDVSAVCGIESRGFIFGAALAYELGVPFVPIRKKGKLPAVVVSASYALEYGHDSIEMHRDALQADDRVVIFDDLIATGGTAEASTKLVKALGAEVIEVACVIELAFLNPRDKLDDYKVYSLVSYDAE